MADRRNRVAKAGRLVKLQRLMLLVDQSRLAILQREKEMLAEHARLLLRQLSDHAAGNIGGNTIAADMLGHLGHRDTIVSNLAELQARVVAQAQASLRMAEQRSELAERDGAAHFASAVTEEAVERMVQSASLPKG
jgi:hypothetical protein